MSQLHMICHSQSDSKCSYNSSWGMWFPWECLPVTFIFCVLIRNAWRMLSLISLYFCKARAPSAQFLCLSSSLSHERKVIMWDKLPLCHHNMQWRNPIQEFCLKNVMSCRTLSPLDCSMTWWWHLHMPTTCIQHCLIHDTNLLALGYNLNLGSTL